jgi:hypothetical protein
MSAGAPAGSLIVATNDLIPQALDETGAPQPVMTLNANTEPNSDADSLLRSGVCS